MNKWNTLPRIEYTAPHVSPDRATAGEALQKRIDDLTAARAALDEEERQRLKAPLGVVQNWNGINSARATLMAAELGIREDYKTWLADEQKDCRAYAVTQEAKWTIAKADVTNTLMAAGFTQEALVGCDVVSRHPSVRALFVTMRGYDIHSDRDRSEVNQRAMTAITNELQTMRDRRLI